MFFGLLCLSAACACVTQPETDRKRGTSTAPTPTWSAYDSSSPIVAALPDCCSTVTSAAMRVQKAPVDTQQVPTTNGQREVGRWGGIGWSLSSKAFS